MFAQRMTRIETSPTMKVASDAARLKRQGVDIVDLGAGEPDFPTPEHVKVAAKAAIDANYTKYTPNAGAPELKQAIIDRYRADYGVEYSEAETIITAGGKQALVNAMLALFGAGDEVITHSPGWPSIVEQIKLTEATLVRVRAHAEDGFALHAEPFLAAVTPRTRGIVINTPCNPTGALMSESVLAEIADYAAARDIWIIVDLCYERLIYDAVPHNVPAVLSSRMRERTVLAGSASKAYAMTGWRCGWALGPEPVISACNALQSHMTSNVCSITQRAATAALTGPQDCVTAMLDEYRDRRDQVWKWLTADPRIRCLRPAGAFYLLLDVSDLLSPNGLRTSSQLATALLDEARVAVTPGEAFDAPGSLRISYATSLERLKEGADRIHAFISRQAPEQGDQRLAIKTTV